MDKFRASTTPYLDEAGDGLDVYERLTGNTQRLAADGRVTTEEKPSTGERATEGVALEDRSRGNKLKELLSHKKEPSHVQVHVCACGSNQCWRAR